MAVTQVPAALQLVRHSKKYFREYVRGNRFNRYMGTDENAIIQVKHELEKMNGDNITFPLLTELTGAGVEGDDILEGNEEAQDSYGDTVVINQLRNAVRVAEMDQRKTDIDYYMAARVQLREWSKSNLRDTIIARMLSPVLDGTTTYAASTVAERNAWQAANTDRVLYGAAKANLSSGDHATSLATVDATTDILSPAMVSLAKRMARDAGPHRMRPVKVKEDEEWFVLFCNKWAFRDFKNHATYQQNLREAMVRGKDNPLFTDGDLIHDGVILREIVEIPVLSGVGASSIDVAPNFLCGAQAVMLAWGSQPKIKVDTFDYDNQRGVATAEIRGLKKSFFNSKQHGMLSLFTAGVADV